MIIKYECETGIRTRVAKALILICTGLGASLFGHAAPVVMTVTGTVAGGGGDLYGIFGVGKELKGQNFTLTITFDDAAAKKTVPDQCPDAPYSTIAGSNPTSPATAVLTIGKGSFTFGKRPGSRWRAIRSLASSCSGNETGFVLEEGADPQLQMVTVRLIPAAGSSPATKSLDWNSPATSSNMDSDPRYGSFMICQPRDFQRFTKGYLMIKSVTIGKP